MLLLSLLAAGLPVFAADQYAGSAKCASCHPVQAASHAATGHAQALRRVSEHPLRDRFQASGLRRGRAVFSISPGQVIAVDGEQRLELPLEWAFGAGGQAVTFVTRVNRDWYVEHAFSWFRALEGFGPTPGQGDLQPGNIQQAAGLLYRVKHPEAGIDGCFECHSTGPLSYGDDNEIRIREAGVWCESCHGPGARHAAGKGSILNPGKQSAAELMATCGRCHRPPAAPGRPIDFNYAWNVRHQTVYLPQSACFKKGKLTCLHCHAAHQPLERRAAYYNARCVECHGSVTAHKAATARNCIDCHMPLVSPQPGLRFANHWIGVYGEGAKLRPRR